MTGTRFALSALLASGCGAGYSPWQPDAGDVDADPCPPKLAAQRIYFNQQGGMYTHGDIDDAATNTSTILRTAEVGYGSFPYSLQSFLEIVEVCAARLSPFNVEVVVADPGDINHIELVFGGELPDTGSRARTGVIPHGCFRYRRPIGFIDTRAIGNDPELLCEEALRLIGLTTGLEPTREPTDVMAVINTRGRTYADVDAACGENSALPVCTCTGEPTQNSYAAMLAGYGSRCGTP